jgi:hypothetical protein
MGYMYCFFYSHEKKLEETKHKLSEAEKVGEDLSELKVALQELQQEDEKIKQKEQDIKKKEKVCICSVIYVCVPKLIIIQIQANMNQLYHSWKMFSRKQPPVLSTCNDHGRHSGILFFLQNIWLRIRRYSICGHI